MTDTVKMKNLLTTHPSFTHSEELRQICSPLSSFGINYFSHVRITTDQQFSFMALRPDFLEHYIRQGYFQCDLHNKTAIHSEQLIIWDNVKLTGQSQLLHDDFRAYGQGHTFSIYLSNKNYRDVYHFAVPNGDEHMNAFYLEHVDLLQSFIGHFTEKVSAHKLLSKAYNSELSLQQAEGAYLTARIDTLNGRNGFKDLVATKRYYINGRDTYLTRRELECLHWIANGKTAEMTAAILKVSPRTIKAHVINIKEKLGCHNYFQLGMMYAKIIRSNQHL